MTEAPFLRTTRDSYDTIARHRPDLIGTVLDDKPLDRALLAVFAEWVGAAGGGPVADVGSGPGRVTAYLRGLGVDAFGVDLSPEMVALARTAHPGVRFEVGSMLDLDVPDGSLAGVLANYSIIHVPWAHRPRVFAEFHRVLAPGGHLMLVFQTGHEHRHFDEVDGVRIALDWYRQQPEEVAALLAEAGLSVRVRVVREPEPGVEQVPRGYLLAQRPGPAGTVDTAG